jgi:hypothetical protein
LCRDPDPAGTYRREDGERSATIEIIDDRGQAVAAGRFGTDKAGYAGDLRLAVKPLFSSTTICWFRARAARGSRW